MIYVIFCHLRFTVDDESTEIRNISVAIKGNYIVLLPDLVLYSTGDSQTSVVT